MFPKIVLIGYAAILLLVSLVAFFLYGKDKRMAKNETAVRIKEKTLLSVAVFGGAIGAFLGRLAFHHKTNKVYFSLVILTSLVFQLVALVILVLNAGGLFA